jgi:hypothetical protein
MLTAVLTCAAANAQAPDAHLTAVLAQLDAASQHFNNARADFTWDYYEAVVRDTTTQTGSIYFERKGTATQMGAVVLNLKTQHPDKILEYKDGVLRVFDTAVDQIRILKAGPNQAQYESFLTLGFGGSGKALVQAWNITDQGSETLTDNGQPVKTEKLDLVSKDAGVRNNFTHVTIWVDPQRGVSLKQVFETPSHDRRTAIYTHIKLNTTIDRGTFAIKSGPHTATIR